MDPGIEGLPIVGRKLHTPKQKRNRTGAEGDAIPWVGPDLSLPDKIGSLFGQLTHPILTDNPDQGGIFLLILLPQPFRSIQTSQGEQRLLQRFRTFLPAQETGGPVPLIRREPEPSVQTHIVENNAAGFPFVPTQPSPHHLQVFGQRERGSCQLDKLHIGTVEPLRKEIDIHEHLNRSGFEPFQV